MASVANSKKKLFSLHWLITLSAFIITAVLIWQNSIDKGLLVELTLNDAAGIETGKTVVKYRSVEIGKVENVRLSDDYSHTVVSARIYPSYENLMKEDTVFWIVSPRVNINSISGLDTLLTGSYFQIYKGSSNEPKDKFDCLPEPPIGIDEDTIDIVINSEAEDLLLNGTSINYHGFEIGMITGNRYSIKDKRIVYTAKIKSKYQSLMGGDSSMWIHPGFDVQIGGDGLKFDMPSFQNFMIGSIDVENFSESDFPLANNMIFTLFENKKDAYNKFLEKGQKGIVFLKNLDDIAVGSPLIYKNTQIGQIIKLPYYEKDIDFYISEEPVPVLFAISNINDSLKGDVEEYFYQKLQSGALAATVTSNSIISKGNQIELSVVKEGTFEKKISYYRNLPVIPVMEKTDVLDNINLFTDKLAKLDLEGITKNLNSTLKSAKSTLDSIESVAKELKDKKTIDNLNRTVASFNSESEVYRSLIEVINRLNKSLSDLDPTIKKVGQKSNALIFSSDEKDVEPKVLRRN